MIDIGSVINGKYRLVRVLGDGGMGSVYEALHLSLGTRMAIKVLHPELARRTGLVERFLQEARVAAQIRSPHVVQVTDVDRTPEGYAYIVMELLEGEPLSSVLDRQRKLSVTIACAYATQILQALEAAHALGVIHRDLKPENVFVTFAGGKPVLKLIDFGIAKARPADQQQKRLTVAGVVMGTAEYMAPEQARSADAVDVRADIYAVGVMLYEMIAGARPVGGTDARIIALKVERGDVIPLLQAAPDTPREVAGLVHRAMAPRPELRFATATEMRLAVEVVATGKRPSTASMTGSRTAGGTLEITGRAGATPSPGAGPSPQPGPYGTPYGIPYGTQGAPPSRPRASPNEDEPAVVTIRAPPIATALAPAAYAGPPVPAFSAPGAPPQRSSAHRWIVAALALLALVFAGIVASALLGVFTGGSSAPASSSISATEEPPAAGHAGTRPAPAEAPTNSHGTDLPSLVPTKPSPAPVRPPSPGPSTHPTAPASATPDAGAPAIVFYPPSLPSTLPPFPSGFPLPAGFPTALPSGFPTALPSGFPTWPPAPAQPAPAAAPSSSGSVY